jgi:hypothetical protein
VTAVLMKAAYALPLYVVPAWAGAGRMKPLAMTIATANVTIFEQLLITVSFRFLESRFPIGTTAKTGP